jgi:RHS repeat-associated protein
MKNTNSKVRFCRKLIPKANSQKLQRTSSRKRRTHFIERLELRQLLAVASPPDQSLLLSSAAIYLAPGHFDLGGPTDLLSVSRTGRIDVAVNNNQNGWATRSTFQAAEVSASNPVLGATTALLNDDAFDDLVLQTASQVVMLVSDGNAGWQSYLTTSYTGVIDAASHPTVQPIAANFGNDTSIDLVLPLPQANQIAVLYGNSDGSFQPPLFISTGSPNSSRPVVTTSGNVLGGPSHDLVIGFDDGAVRFFEGDKQGALQLRGDLTLINFVGAVSALQTFDFDGDGVSEIAATGRTGAALLKSLTDPLATSPIVNGDFSQGLTGWQTQFIGQTTNQNAGTINAQSAIAQLAENQSFLTSLSQSFTIPANPQSIEFDLIALGLGSVSSGQLPDAFEVSLLSSESNSLVPTHQPSSTAFINFNPGNTPSIAAGVTILGTKVRLDISRLTPGTTADLVFDLIGNPNANTATATIDNVRITPDIVRNDAFSVTKLTGAFGNPSDVAIGDVDGDNLSDIVVSDSGLSTLVVYNGIGGVAFARSVLNVASTGSPSKLTLGAFTAPDPILDIAAAFSGASLALTPLLADTTLPTALLLAPQPSVTLETNENATAALGSVILQFSEAMQVSTAATPGSANNPRSYRFYNLGPDGVDNRGTGDDVLFPITAVNYNSTTNLATLAIDRASLADPTRAAGSIYKVLVLGASQTHGLRDLAGNLLDGGQDIFAVVNVARQPQLELPQSLMTQEGSSVSFIASLAHNTFGPNYSATIHWGDGTSNKVSGSDSFPVEQFISSHVYAVDGSYSVTVVTDINNATLATQSVTLQVQNVAPILGALANLSANEGSSVAFQFTASDPGIQDTLTATIHWGDGTTSTVTPTPSSSQFQFNTTHTFPDNGTFQVQVTLSDGSDTVTSTTTAEVANVAPSFATENLTGVVGQALNVAPILISDPGFNSTNSNVETFTASIDWGDGSGIQPTAITDYVAGKAGMPTTANLGLVHTYASVGQFTVLVTVSDDDGSTVSKSFLVNVQPNTNGSACLPVIDFNTDALGNSLPVGTKVADNWSNWGVHITTNDPAKHPMALLSHASHGAADSLLVIADKASTTTPSSYTGGGTINFYFDATVRVDQLRLFKIPRGQTATVRWYDRASTMTGESTVTGADAHLYQTVTMNAIGIRRLEIQFTGAGAISDLTFCSDQVPGGTVQTTGPLTTREGDTFTLNLAGLANTDGWTINWGDGKVSTLPALASRADHVFADGPSNSTIRAFARQGANVFAAQPLTLAIENVIPKLTIAGNANVNASEMFTLQLAVADPGADTIQGWLIDWGDGSKPQLVAGNPNSVVHAYTRQGTYTVRAHAFDEDYDGPRYSPSVGSLLQVQARGDEGGERFDLLIDDQVVQSFVTTTAFQTFSYATTKPIAPNQVKVRFTNDYYDPNRGIDNNLIVDYLTIDGKVFQTEASDVYSTGTWRSADGVKPGLRKSEWLHANGLFHYDYDGNDGTRIVIRARGDLGDESFSLLIDGRTVKRWTATTAFTDYEFRSSRIVSPGQICVAFTNDLYDKWRNIDRNLTVDFVSMNETVYQTEDRSVFSNGTWLSADGIQPGYGRGQILNSNGYFQFAEVPAPSPFDTAWVSNATSVVVKPEKSSTLPTIDFERAANSTPLRHGDTIVNQFSALGVTVSTNNKDTIATIIDSAASLKNVLAISEKDDDDHDHDHDDDHDLKLTSGTLTFSFKSAVQMDEVHLYNVTKTGSRVRLYGADGNLISDTSADNLGSKSFQKVILNAVAVRRMEIVLTSPAAIAAIVSSRLASPIAAPATKFYVVDSNDSTYRYTSAGSSVGQFTVSPNLNARDITTTPIGNPLWILSDEGSNKRIYVTDSEQEKLLGSWIATGLTKPEGIATDGQSIWIVDDATNRVQRYDEAALRRSGSQAKSSQFNLDTQNQSPKGITTDGEFLWVVDSSSDRVFVYDLAGNLLNSWRLDAHNSEPTGLTINAEGNRMWVVDADDDRVYVYTVNSLGPHATTTAESSFPLASKNSNPQGIADPGGLYTIGQIRTSNIATPGAIDDYSFSGNAGQTIYVNFQLLSEGGLQSSLFAPDGSLIYTRDDTRVFIHNSGAITLTQSGSYTLRLASSATPAYQFQIFDVPPPEVKPVTPGQSNSGGIEIPGAQDQWTFTGRGGSDVYLDVLSLDTVFGGDVIFAIVAPDGSTISERSSTVQFRVDQGVTLPVDGQYRIVVKADFNGSQLPTYSFQLWEVPPDDIQSLAFRQTAIGAIEVPGAKDRWTFTATSGQNIFLDFLSVTAGELQVSVTAPDGTLIYDIYSGLESTLDKELVLPQTGTYTVSTRAALGSPSLNTYSFQVWDIPIESLQPAVLNENIFGSIVPGEAKLFAFVAQANTPILLDVINSSGGTLGVSLINPDGTILSDSVIRDSLLTLPQSGSYRAIIKTSSTDPSALDAYGSFSFRLQDASSPEIGGTDSLGTRFYIGFPRNLLGLLGPSFPDYSISITSAVSTSGTIQIPDINQFFSFDVAAGQTTTIPLPPEVEIFTSDQTNNKGILVTAIDEIAVYGLNQLTASTDGYTALPVDALGRSYIVLGYGNTVHLAGGGGTSLTIVGTADSTNITITPAVSTPARPAGIPFNVTLNAGQAYTLYVDTETNNVSGVVDLTGTIVTADKPISVFGGNTAAFVPAGFEAADHLIEQLPPIETWGKRFVTQPLATRTRGDTFRVLAQSNDTAVFINGTLVTTLAAGRFYETILTTASTIDTSQPALVAQYSHGQAFDNAPSDPFMMLVPPAEQFQSDYTLSTPVTNFDINYANLVVPIAALASVRRDGQPIPSSAFTPIGTSGFAGGQIPIGVGSHHFTAQAPFGVSIYGFRQVESYGYFGGTSLAPLTRVASLSLSPSTITVPINTQQTVTAHVADQQGNPLRGVRVEFAVAGNNLTSGFSFTDATGRASFQFTGTQTGTDSVTASAAGTSQTASITWSASLPTVNIQSPLPQENLSVGKRLLVGSARPAVPDSVIVEVLVDGIRVEAVDTAGSFIAPIAIVAGNQRFTVIAIDSLGQESSASITVTGVEDETAGFENGFGVDATSTTQVQFTGTTFNRTTNRLSVDMRVKNLNADAIDSDTAVRFDAIDPTRVGLLNPDQRTADGLPLILLNSKIPTVGLGKDQASTPSALSFDNPVRDRFATEVTVLTRTNRPPQFTSAPPMEATVNRPYRYSVTAIDPDGSSSLAYQLVSAPGGMAIDSATGSITWTPTVADASTHTITIRVSDARGGEAMQTFALNVALSRINRPPVFTTSPVIAAAPLAAYRYAASARDIDGDTVVYSLTQASAGLTIDAASGVLSSVGLLAGIYPILITADDSRGGLATQEFTLFVGTNPTRSVPIITSAPAVIAYVNLAYIYSIAVSETNFAPSEFQLMQAPAGMTITPAGRIAWVPQASQTGPHNVRVVVTNPSGGSASQSFTVEAIQQRPSLGPQFVSTPLRVASTDQDYRYTAIATDPEQAMLSYSLLFAPVGMTINAQTGEVFWKPTGSQVGPQRVQVNAMDAQGLTAIQTFAIDVRPSNTAPAFSSTPITSTMVGDAYRYNALATDREDAVTYSLTAGPTSGLSGMQIDPRSGAITWQPRTADIGNYTVTVRATDDRNGFTDQTFDLSVAPDSRGPSVSIRLERATINVGDSTRIDVRAYDASGIASVAISIDGQIIPLNSSGSYIFTASTSGIPNIVATAVDRAGNTAIVSADPALRVLDATDTEPPLILLTAPTSGATVTYLTDIVGTITDRNLEYFELQYSLANTNQWTTFTHRQFRPDPSSNSPSDGINNGLLGIFDPTLLPNDTYHIRAFAQDTNGAHSSSIIELSVESQAKIGNFHYDAVQSGCTECRAGFSDLDVNVAGIPISIQRSYDTLDAHFSGDFGYGWRMAITNPRIRESVRPSESELAGAGPLTANPFRVGTRVYMNAPDGRRIGFTFDPVPVGGLLGTIWTPRFTPDPGVKYQLEVENTPLSQNANGAFGLYLLNLPYNPDRYTLVSKEQLRLTYDQFSDLQLQSISDRNGVQLTFTEDGIFSSLGPQVVWQRDSLNRITSITDPAGNVLKYSYDHNGDLVSFEDQVGNVTSMSYLADPAHFLQSVVDPRGFEIMKLTYDADHRMIGLADALGNTERRSYDMENNTEVVADYSGSETILVFDDRGNIIHTTDPLGNVFQADFNQDDKPIRLTDYNGGVTAVTYDVQSNVTQVIDPVGHIWKTTYNARNDRTSSTDPDGKLLTFEYDDRGNLVKTTDQLGRTNSLVVDSVGRTIALTNAAGNTWSFEFGEFDTASRIINPDGTFRAIDLNSWGEMVGVTDENGVTYQFERDAANRITQVNLVKPEPASSRIRASGTVTLAALSTRQFIRNKLVEETDALGRVTKYNYDANGQIDEITDPMGGQYKTIYNWPARTIETIDPLGNKTRYEYDQNNQLTKVVNAAGGTSLYTFDARGNLFQMVDEAGLVTKHTYDLDLRRTKTQLPDGSVITFKYDAYDNITRATGPRGEVTQLFYDDAHQLIEMIDPMQGVYQWQYDLTGNPTRYTDPRGHVSSHLYDDRNRLTLSTDALGFSERFTYDGIGRVLDYIDQVGARTSFVYDSEGRLTSQTYPDGGLRQFEYDAVGNQTKAIDPLGRTSQATYDDLDRLITSTDPLGALTTFTYDAMSNVLSLTDASGNLSKWTYDQMNRVVLWTDPLGATESFTYDDAIPNSTDRRGNLVAHTDRLGRTMVYSYDSRNRNTSVQWQDANGLTVDTITRQYDATDNLIAISDSDSQLAFTYDLNSRLLTADNLGTPNVRRTVLTNSWDDAGNRIRVQDGDGVRVDSTYDARDLLSTRSWSASGASTVVAPASVSMSYNGRGQVTELLRYSNADLTQLVSQTQRTYDSLGRSQQISHRSAIDAVLAEFDTEWDQADQLTKLIIDGQPIDYRYDHAGQLLSAKRVSDRSLDETYTYDANANRTSSSQLSSQVIGTNNRLLSDSRYEYRYDAAGNLIDRREPATGIHDRYEYDHLNHLTRSQRVSSSGAVLSTVEYRYDALGRRIARTVDSDGAGPVAAASENFVYDGLNVWLDADAAGNVTARYLFGDDIDEPLARYRPGEGTSWYLTDHLGSVRNILNSVGTVVDTIDYDSFGNILSETSPQFGDRYKYTAREWDSQLGLYYYRARLYSPSTGRFTTEDPIGFAGGQVNLTAYVGNAPTIYIDPLGLSAEGAATLAWGTRVANAETGALVGGSLGFACGFLEGLYRTGSVEGALDAGANEALIGGGAGAVFGFAGAATSVWARYLNGIFLLGGGALALNHIYQGEDLAIKTIRSACGVIGFGLGFSTFMPTPRVPTKFPNVALPIVDRTFVPKAPVHVLLMEQASRRGFATGQSEAIVWTGTGRGNYWLKRSQRYATENGGKTLEMTDGGKYLDDFDLFGQNSPLSLYEAMEVWELASRQFAIGARGQVRAVVGTIRPSSVFNRIELPELLYNPNVWGIDILFLHPGVGLR